MAKPKKSKKPKATRSARRAERAAERRKYRPGIDALEWQEAHSPTVEIAVDDPEATRKARRNLTKCRQSEAFRHNRLDGMQQEALVEMDRAYRMRTSGVGPTRSSFGPRTGRGGSPESASLEQAWVDWCERAVKDRIMVPAVMACIFEVKTLTQIEHDYRMRRGQAFNELVSALHLWAELRGWTKGPRMQAHAHLLPEHAI